MNNFDVKSVRYGAELTFYAKDIQELKAKVAAFALLCDLKGNEIQLSVRGHMNCLSHLDDVYAISDPVQVLHVGSKWITVEADGYPVKADVAKSDIIEFQIGSKLYEGNPSL